MVDSERVSHKELLIVTGAQNTSKEIAVDRAQQWGLAVLIIFEFPRRIRQSSHSTQ